LLQNVYKDAFSVANREAILESALIRAYAKPLLSALVLYVLGAKLVALINVASAHLAPAERDKLARGITTARDGVAGALTTDDATMRALVTAIGRGLSLFRTGTPPATGAGLYQALTASPLHLLPGDNMIAGSGLSELAIAAALLGMGLGAGMWNVSAGSPADPKAGILTLANRTASTKIFFAANSQAEIHLRRNGIVADSDNAVVVHSLEISPAMPRSSRRALGRKGKPALSEVSIRALLALTLDADDLLQKFRQKIGL
jgi:hypothetical protein